MIIIRRKGGPGSGHWGHASKPGHKGGSLPKDVAMSRTTGRDASSRQSLRRAYGLLHNELYPNNHAEVLGDLIDDSPSQLGDFLADYEPPKPKEPVVAPATDKKSKVDVRLDTVVVVNSFIDSDIYAKLEGMGLTDDPVSFVNDTYNVVDAKTGLRTEVRNVQSSRRTIEIEGNIYDANGEYAGKFRRKIYENDDGELEVHHDYFSLNEKYQNNGFGKRWLEHCDNQYLGAGVRVVTLYANLDKGGYSWAKMGFDFDTIAKSSLFDRSDAAYNIITIIKNKISMSNLSDAMTSSAIKALDTMISDNGGVDAVSSWHLASFSFNGVKFGKDAMMGMSWDGIKEIDPTSPGWQVAQAYYGNE